MSTLSERLSMVASMALRAADEIDALPEGSKAGVADIGTDHGYLPIYLAEQQATGRVIAMDVNEGPLERARANVAAAGLSDRIELRRSDGFAGLTEGEVQIAVLSGMGGRLIREMMDEHDPRTLGIHQLILQPQSDVRELWDYLMKNDWAVVEERMVFEEGKFYTMMRAVQTEDHPVKKEDDFGAILSAGRDETWHLFLEKERAANQILMEKIEEENGPQERIRELADKQANIEAALSIFRQGGGTDETG